MATVKVEQTDYYGNRDNQERHFPTLNDARRWARDAAEDIYQTGGVSHLRGPNGDWFVVERRGVNHSRVYISVAG